MIDNPYSLSANKRNETETLIEILKYARGGKNYPEDRETAKEMIDKFGSLSNVLTADISALLNTKGLNESVAVFISLFKGVAKQINNNKINGIKRLNNTAIIKEYCHAVLELERNECFIAIALNDNKKIISYREISSGSVNQSSVEIRKLLDFLLDCDASFAVVAHNHPHLSAEPSQQDILVTRQLIWMLSAVNIELIDHIIVGSNYDYSILTECDNQLLFIE